MQASLQDHSIQTIINFQEKSCRTLHNQSNQSLKKKFFRLRTAAVVSTAHRTRANSARQVLQMR